MGTSYVTLGRDAAGNIADSLEKQVGFWMSDGTLELWLRLLALHIEDPSPNDDRQASLVRNIRDQWLLASRGYFGGWVPHGLEDAVSTEAGFGLVKNAVRSLSAALEGAPENLSAGVLNLLGVEGGKFGDVKSTVLADVARAFHDLLDGRIRSANMDGAFMPGVHTPISIDQDT